MAFGAREYRTAPPRRRVVFRRQPLARTGRGPAVGRDGRVLNANVSFVVLRGVRRIRQDSGMPRRPAPLVALLFAVLAAAIAARRADTVPAALTDREFWSLVGQLSEPNGVFVSRSGSPDNLLSNEMPVSTVAAAVARQVPPSGVYLGVGPEQNFTYIAVIEPRIAFITDIRRGNLDLHLVYKALFEMSSSRADFAARLFNRRFVRTLSRSST